MSVQNIELVRSEANVLHWTITTPSARELMFISADNIIVKRDPDYEVEDVTFNFSASEIETLYTQKGATTTYQLVDLTNDEILFTGSVTLTGEGGGTPAEVVFEDLPAMQTTALIEDVPVTAEIELIKAGDGEYYKKNLAGDAYEKMALAEPNVYNVKNTMSVAEIQAVIDAATAGQVVKFAPGTYALGASALIFKDGVHMDCGVEGSVTFTSSNATGTLYDNNVEAVLTLSGFPVITNTVGLAKRIVLQNASSAISGFWWEYIANLAFAESPSLTIVKNTTGDTFAFTKTGTGGFLLDGNGAYIDSKCVKYFNINWSGTPVNSLVFCSLIHGLYGDYTKIVLNLYDAANTLVDIGTLQFKLMVYP